MNCRYNEKSVFSRPFIKSLMNQYTLVHLYTDTVPLGDYPPNARGGVNIDRQEADAQANKQLQIGRFGTNQLPLYAVVNPGGRIREIVAVTTRARSTTSKPSPSSSQNVGNGKTTAQARPVALR